MAPIGQRLRGVAFARRLGTSAAARKMRVSSRTIRRWLKEFPGEDDLDPGLETLLAPPPPSSDEVEQMAEVDSILAEVDLELTEVERLLVVAIRVGAEELEARR